MSDDEGDKNQPTTKLKEYITKYQACDVGDLVPMNRVKKWQPRAFRLTWAIGHTFQQLGNGFYLTTIAKGA